MDNTEEVSEDNSKDRDSLDISDLSNLNGGMNKGLILLQRLQQLKVRLFCHWWLSLKPDYHQPHPPNQEKVEMQLLK